MSSTEQPSAAPNAAEVLVNSSRAIHEAYSRYVQLRGLAASLNGLPESAPLPPELKIDSVTATYTVNDGAPVTVEFGAVGRVGDLARLVGREIDQLIDTMRSEALTVQSAAEMISSVCSSVRYAANAQDAETP